MACEIEQFARKKLGRRFRCDGRCKVKETLGDCEVVQDHSDFFPLAQEVEAVDEANPSSLREVAADLTRALDEGFGYRYVVEKAAGLDSNLARSVAEIALANSPDVDGLINYLRDRDVDVIALVS